MITLMEVLKSLAPWFTAAIVVVLGPIVKDLIPEAVKGYLSSIYQDYFFPRLTMIITGNDDDLGQNQIYEAAKTYVRNKVSVSPKPRHFKCRKAINVEKLVFDIAGEDSIIDNFRGISLKWKKGRHVRGRKTAGKCFELSFDKRSEEEVLKFYIPHLLARAEEIRKEEQMIKLYCRDREGLNSGKWKSMILEHPATFEKLAMELELQDRLKDDLDRFVKRKDWYTKVGRAWKRGYLIYGPPGTGKSSLIAAMANYLKFDIYELEISSIKSDSDLRSTLLSTSNRSIMIIEDIDCAQLEKRGQEKTEFSAKFTLSGLLNVIDGLWSSCGDERIFVFTTNHKDDLDRLDPALFRPGRMDVHVSMSYCTMYGFKKLASTYLDFNGNHELYGQIEQLLGNLEVTPAEIAEEFSRSENPDVAFRGVVKYLEKKDEEKKKNEEKKNELVNAIST